MLTSKTLPILAVRESTVDVLVRTFCTPRHVLVSVKRAFAGTDLARVYVHAVGFPPEKYTGWVADPVVAVSSLTALVAEPPADEDPAYFVGIFPFNKKRKDKKMNRTRDAP